MRTEHTKTSVTWKLTAGTIRPLGIWTVLREAAPSTSCCSPEGQRSKKTTPVGDRYLLATGDGDMYLVAEAQGEQKLKVQHVPYRIPINADEFTAAVGSKIDATSFRAADVLVQELEGKTRLFATHHFWKADQQCFVMRISMLESTDSAFLTSARPELAWKTIYESTPCIPIEFPGRPPHFSGSQSAGAWQCSATASCL